MKKFFSFLLSLCIAGSHSRKCLDTVPAVNDGVELGANETLTADGIALGNAVKLRGYVDRF